MTAEERAEVARIVAEQCEAQGIPLRIDDPVTLARIANLLKMPRAGCGTGSKVRRGKSDTAATAVSCV